MRAFLDAFIRAVETQPKTHAQDEVCKDIDDLGVTKVEATPLLIDGQSKQDSVCLDARDACQVTATVSLNERHSIDGIDASGDETTIVRPDINHEIRVIQQNYLSLFSEYSEQMGLLSSADEQRCRSLTSEVQSQWIDCENEAEEGTVEQLMLLKITVENFKNFLSEVSTKQRRNITLDATKKSHPAQQVIKQKKLTLKDARLQKITDLISSGTASEKNNALSLLNEYMAEKECSLKQVSAAVSCLAKWSELNGVASSEASYYSSLISKFEKKDSDTQLADEQLIEKIVDLDTALLRLEGLRDTNNGTWLLYTGISNELKDHEHFVHLMLKSMTSDDHWPPGEEERVIFEKIEDYINAYAAEKNNTSEEFSNLGNIYQRFIDLLSLFLENQDLRSSIISMISTFQEAYAVASGYDNYLFQSGKKQMIVRHNNKINALRNSNRFESIPGENELSLVKEGADFFEYLSQNKTKNMAVLKREGLDKAFSIIRQELIDRIIKNRLDNTAGQMKDEIGHLLRGVKLKLFKDVDQKEKVGRHKRIEAEVNNILEGYARLEINEDNDEFTLLLTKDNFQDADDEEKALNVLFQRLSSGDKGFIAIKDAFYNAHDVFISNDGVFQYMPVGSGKLFEVVKSINSAIEKIVAGFDSSQEFIDDTDMKTAKLHKEADVAKELKKNNQDMIKVINKILIRKRDTEIEKAEKDLIRKKRKKGFRKYLPRPVHKLMKWAGLLSDKHFGSDVDPVKIPGSGRLVGLRNKLKVMNMSDISAIRACLEDCSKDVLVSMKDDSDDNAVYYKILLHFLEVSNSVLKMDDYT